MVVVIAYWLIFFLLPLLIVMALGFWIGIFPFYTNSETALWILVMICMVLSGWLMNTLFPNPYPEKLVDWFSEKFKWLDD